MTNVRRENTTEERLEEAALRVFARHGFAGATVKEIADDAGVNISLISYHYEGKEGLYRTCLERFGKERLEIAQRILTAPQTRDDLAAKLRLWMDQFLEAQVENPEICTIINREMMTDFRLVKDIFGSTFLRSFQTLGEFIESAKKRGLIRKALDSEMIACMIFGTICQLGRSESIQAEFFSRSIRDPKYRSHAIEQLLAVILSGVENEDH